MRKTHYPATLRNQALCLSVGGSSYRSNTQRMAQDSVTQSRDSQEVILRVCLMVRTLETLSRKRKTS
jgi:hypothetical protein